MRIQEDARILQELQGRAEQARRQYGFPEEKSVPARGEGGRFVKPARPSSPSAAKKERRTFKGPRYLNEKTHTELAVMLLRVVGQRQWLLSAARKIAPEQYNGRMWPLQPLWMSGATKQRRKVTLQEGVTYESRKLAVLEDVIRDLSENRDTAGLASAKTVARLMTAKMKQLGIGKAYEGASISPAEPYVHATSLYREPFRSVWAQTKEDGLLDVEPEIALPPAIRRQSRKWLISRYVAAMADVRALDAALKCHYGARRSRTDRAAALEIGVAELTLVAPPIDP